MREAEGGAMNGKWTAEQWVEFEKIRAAEPKVAPKLDPGLMGKMVDGRPKPKPEELGEIKPPPPLDVGKIDVGPPASGAKSAALIVQTPEPLTMKRGEIETSFQNAKRALGWLGIHCRFDEFHGRYLIEDSKNGVSLHQESLDDVVRFLRNAIYEAMKFDPGTTNTFDALLFLARQNSFDPVRDYLDGLRWDGVPRLDRWLTTYFGAKDDPLTSAIGRKTLVAGVRRVRQPGCQFDFVPVLEGKQGGGKSSALRILAGDAENFTDGALIHLAHQEQQELLNGRWIVELAELAGLNKVEVEKFKNFASKTHDSARPAYGRGTVDQPRHCILIGTTNETAYLQDATGNRRFWPVATGWIDLAGLRKDRDQLWAEASAIEAKEEALTIDRKLWGEAASRQADRLHRDPWEDVLENIEQSAGSLVPEVGGVLAIDSPSEFRVSTTYLLNTMLELPSNRARVVESRRLADVMRKLGWEGPFKMRFGSALMRGYRKKRGRSLLELLNTRVSDVV